MAETATNDALGPERHAIGLRDHERGKYLDSSSIYLGIFYSIPADTTWAYIEHT